MWHGVEYFLSTLQNIYIVPLQFRFVILTVWFFQISVSAGRLKEEIDFNYSLEKHENLV